MTGSILFDNNINLKAINFSMKRDHPFHKFMFDYTSIDFERLKKIIPI